MTESKQTSRKEGSRIAPRPRRMQTSSRAALEQDCATLRRLCEELREHAEMATRMQGELLSVVTHDIRNPLSVVLVSSRLLLKTAPPDGSTRRQLDAIGRAADEINQMIQDLVDAASIQAGRLSVGKEPNPISPLVDRALDAVQPLASLKPVTLHKDVAADLPLVPCDGERIAQVLTNLVLNATRFTPKGGTVHVRCERHGGDARFAITDTGPGIAAEDRSLVFVKRFGGRRQISQGTGLAVYVARGIVEAHGGTMWIESEPGHGSTFWFTLPAGAGARAPQGNGETGRKSKRNEARVDRSPTS